MENNAPQKITPWGVAFCNDAVTQSIAGEIASTHAIKRPERVRRDCAIVARAPGDAGLRAWKYRDRNPETGLLFLCKRANGRAQWMTDEQMDARIARRREARRSKGVKARASGAPAGGDSNDIVFHVRDTGPDGRVFLGYRHKPRADGSRERWGTSEQADAHVAAVEKYQKENFDRVRRACVVMHGNMLQSARVNGVLCTATIDDLVETWNRQGGRCPATGWLFERGHVDAAPSVDRHRPGSDYAPELISIISRIANTYKSDYETGNELRNTSPRWEGNVRSLKERAWIIERVARYMDRVQAL